MFSIPPLPPNTIRVNGRNDGHFSRKYYLPPDGRSEPPTETLLLVHHPPANLHTNIHTHWENANTDSILEKRCQGNFMFNVFITLSLNLFHQVYRESQKKRNDSFLTIKRSNMDFDFWYCQQDIYKSFLLRPFSGLYDKLFVHNLYLNGEWAKKKYTDFGQYRFWLT